MVREETGMSFGLEWWEKVRKSGGDHFVKELVVAMRGYEPTRASSKKNQNKENKYHMKRENKTKQKIAGPKEKKKEKEKEKESLEDNILPWNISPKISN